MAVQHLTSLLTSLNLPEEMQQAVKHSTQSVINAFILRLSTSSLIFPERRQRFKPKPPKEDPPPPPPKPKIDKKTRDEQFEEQKMKTEETKEFTKKLIEDRIERQKRNQEREREFRMKALQEMEEQRKQQEEIMKKLEEEKLLKLNDLAKKGEIRKKIIEEKKEEISRSPVNVKPLYKQMEDAYKQKVLMPQLEQHKAELAKKRMDFQPLNPDELKAHSKHHEELRRQFEYRRKKEIEQKKLDAQLNLASNSLQSKFTIAVLEEEKRKKEEQERRLQEKQLNINKRLQYSKLVKEMFIPTSVDPSKLEDASRSKSKSKIKSAEIDRNSAKRKIGVTDYKSDIGFRPSLPKKKEPVETKEVKTIDYLAEKRKVREQNPKQFKNLHVELQKEIEDEIDHSQIEKIKAKAEIIDQRAKLKEMKMGKYGKEEVKGIKAGDKVNDMIISSIRAKLALLDKFQSK
jgi:hypothetical protein